MNITQLFFDEDKILRSGWRVAFFLCLFVFLYLFLGAIAFFAFPSLFRPSEGSVPLKLLVNASAMFIAALAAGWIAAKFLERLSLNSLGLALKGRWPLNLALGTLIGGMTVSLAAGLAWLLAGTEFVWSNFSTDQIIRSLAISGIIFLIAATAEELVFRGYIFQTLVRADQTAIAILLTSILFAMVHQGNPGANILGWANTFLAGIWFGVAYLKTKELWFVSGMHFAWNWLQGSLYGIEVSGLTDIAPHPILKEIESGPAWIGGGNYGLEGGIVTTFAIILSTAVIYLLPIKASGKEPEPQMHTDELR